MLLEKNLNNKYHFDFNILFLSFFIILFKWLISFLIFENENLINKIIFDITDIHYFPYIFNLLELNFSPDYISKIFSEKNIPIPFYSIFFHSISFKIFGFSGFIILELIFLYIFLLLISKILTFIGINYFLSLSISLILFCLPVVFSNFEIFNINLNIISGLFSFRFPRPLVTSCYFFWGVYLAIKYYKDENFSLINFVYIGICLSLIFVSYYYNFINLFILFLILFSIKIFQDKRYLIKNYRKILLSILIFILFATPYLLLFYFSEKDFSSMMGMINLNFDLKTKLLSHFLSKIFTLKFIFVFSLISIFMAMLLKLKKNLDKKNIKFFYYLFLSSIISPFFFTIVSPSISEIYHFLNWIIIISVFVLMIYIFLLIDTLLTKNSFYLIKSYKIYLISLSFIIILIFQIFNFKYIVLNNDKELRRDYSNVQKFIENNSNNLNILMSFSMRSQVLWIFKNKTKFTSIDAGISSLNFEQLEKVFFENLKFLKISNDNFAEIISNKKGSWRYSNKYISYISLLKYQANSLVTFKDSKDYSSDELNFILNSSPTKTQQTIIPKFEIIRLVNSYKNFIEDNDFQKPDLIILDKDTLISKFSNIDEEVYCELNGYNFLRIYTLRKFNICN